MLGLAVAKQTDMDGRHTYVYLYFTESTDKDGSDVSEGKLPLGNRLYRYEFADDMLMKPRLLLDLPSKSGAAHNGGKIVIGPDKNLYIIIGDLTHATKAQNIVNGSQSDGRGGILRVTLDGKPVGDGILGTFFPLNLYYGYGIRNGFGLAFDPLTQMLWDTENGPDYGNEINLVEPGFNGGWKQVQGLSSMKDSFLESDLENFGGKGKYGDPEFTWNGTVGVTGLSFFDSNKLGKPYMDDLFVGDYQGNLYHFKLDRDRTEFVLKNQLSDNIANSRKELTQLIFGKEFGAITDLQIGPGDYLYVLTISGRNDCQDLKNESPACATYNAGTDGTIYKILKK